MNILECRERNDELVGKLLEIWKESVSATHTFLTGADIDKIARWRKKREKLWVLQGWTVVNWKCCLSLRHIEARASERKWWITFLKITGSRKFV